MTSRPAPAIRRRPAASFRKGASTLPTLGTPTPSQTERLAAHHGLVLLTLRVVLPLGERLLHLAFGSTAGRQALVSRRGVFGG